MFCAGFKISNATLVGLVQRYSNKKGHIEFDDFIHCVARMKTMFGEASYMSSLKCCFVRRGHLEL